MWSNELCLAVQLMNFISVLLSFRNQIFPEDRKVVLFRPTHFVTLKSLYVEK